MNLEINDYINIINSNYNLQYFLLMKTYKNDLLFLSLKEFFFYHFINTHCKPSSIKKEKLC
jgi:hypothetical protein